MSEPNTASGDFAKRYGPWAVVTGASDGIGRAMARAIAGRGLDLALVARRRERLEALAIPLADELAMIDVNCRSAFEMTRLCADRFATRGSGGVILMSSIVAFQGAPNAATKAYIQALAEGLRPDLARKGVEVIASAPGPVASGFASRARMAMGKAETPETVAKETLAALGRRTTVRPGFMGKFLGYSLSTMPRFGRSIVMGSIM